MLLLAAACPDPAKGKAKAVTTEAAAQPEKPAAGTAYTIEPSSSEVHWVGSKVTRSHEGGFKTFKGSATVAEGAPEKGSVNVEIDTSSIFTDDGDLQDHLKSPDFFDVAKFPKATFASTAIAKQGDGYSVTGNLTLHGVTRAITFPAKIRTTPAGLEVDAEFAINRKDFGILYPGKADDLIRDDAVIKLKIRAAKA